MKRGLSFRALFVCLQVAACAPNPPAQSQTARVTAVIDGDTIELRSGERVRYLHIDTPEVRRRVGSQWVYAPEPFAEQAKERNRALVESQVVRLEFDVRTKDRYGRLLAFVYVGETMVNRVLVEEGLADLLIIPPNVKYEAQFKAARDKAREARVGLWAN